MKATHLVLSLLALTALVGCGNKKQGESKEESKPVESESTTSEESTPVESESEEPVETDPLAWNEIGGTAYVNIYGDIGVTLRYNDKDVNNGDYIHLADDRNFDYVGVFSASTYNFVYVLQSTSEEGTQLSCVVNPGILKESVGEYLTTVAVDYLKGKNKGYIAISTGDEIKWDTNKSKAMNDLIEKQVEIVKTLD